MDLHVLAVDTDGAAAEFDAVEDDVVGLGADFGGVGVEQREVFVERGGEGVVLGDVAVLRGVVSKLGNSTTQRNFHWPSGIRLSCAGDLLAEFAEDAAAHGFLVGDEEEQVAVVGAGELCGVRPACRRR